MDRKAQDLSREANTGNKEASHALAQGELRRAGLEGYLKVFREHLGKTLERGDIDQLIETLVAEQCEKAQELVSLFGIAREDLPTKDQVYQSIIDAQLTPRQAQEILSYKEPTLLLVPKLPAERYIAALNHEALQITEERKPAYLQKEIRRSINHWAEHDRTTDALEFDWIIADGAQFAQTADWDDVELAIYDRLQKFKDNFNGSNISLMNCSSAALIIMSWIIKGQPPEKNSQAIIMDTVGQMMGFALYAMARCDWKHGNVCFAGATGEYSANNLSLRSMVSGRIAA